MEVQGIVHGLQTVGFVLSCLVGVVALGSICVCAGLRSIAAAIERQTDEVEREVLDRQPRHRR